MKSVCLVVQNIYDIDPRVRRKAEALVAAGYEVDVLALQATGGEKSYSLNGVNVRTIALGKKRGSLSRYFFEYATFFLWVLFCTPMLMLRRRYVVIDVNTLPDFLIFASVAARWMGAKLILDMHEITPEFYMSKYGIAFNSWIIRLLTWLEKMSFNVADHVITVSKPIEDLLVSRGLPPAKSTIVMNAVDEVAFATRSVLPLVSPAINQQKFVMMYHGTLTKLYGLDIAIEAFAMAHRDMPQAELWILGAGPEADALASLAQKRGLAPKLRLIGRVSPTEIPAWLNRCDAGLLPFRRDVFLDYVFPNKLPEFIVMGKAVIVSRLKGIGHYFSELALAYFEPNDPADLARQMVRLYRDRDLRTKMAVQAASEYEPIRWSVMRDRYLELVNRLPAENDEVLNPVGSSALDIHNTDKA